MKKNSQLKWPAISIIIRTLNEEKYLGECLKAIERQSYPGLVEKVIVDSGSTDDTLRIARENKTKIELIDKKLFSFGRSLNQGCEASSGQILVMLSAHCIPTNNDWLIELVKPIIDKVSEYNYGRQIPREAVSKFSEGMVYRQYYPAKSAVPQEGYFCNNANSSISRKTWEKYKFNEELTGLEDLDLARRLLRDGGRVSYISQSVVEHIHEESWTRIRTRYEREAAALLLIDPTLSLTATHATGLFLASVFNDWGQLKIKSLANCIEVLLYRFNQYLGSFVGSKASKRRVALMKNEYYYPRHSYRTVQLGYENENHSITANEGTQRARQR